MSGRDVALPDSQHLLATRSAPELCQIQNTSSPPGLTRWSMLTCGSESLSADPIELLVRMDCRIKSGNDERKKEAKRRQAHIQ
jgi:hypothetical protein